MYNDSSTSAIDVLFKVLHAKKFPLSILHSNVASMFAVKVTFTESPNDCALPCTVSGCTTTVLYIKIIIHNTHIFIIIIMGFI